MKRRLLDWLAAGAIVLAGVATARPQEITIRTLAGNGTAGATNGFGSNARFNQPAGVSADALGNVYVADAENGTVRKITPDGFVSTLAGLAGSFGSVDGAGSNARFYGPQGVAADGSGQVYVADSANSTIRRMTAVGVVTTVAGSAGVSNSFDGAGPNARFFHPEAIVTDPGGTLYVADTWNHTIRKITPAGIVTTLAGLAGNSGAADGTNSKARFNRPAGLAIDTATNLFVADSLNHVIRKITPAGKVTTVAGLPGIWGRTDGTNRDARFYHPEGIAVTASGELLVADSGNQTLRKITPSGTNWLVSTVAGTPGLAGSANGTGPNAHFYFPGSLTVDSAGFLYVADAANHTVRTTRVVPPTLLYTVAGNEFVLSWPVSAEGFVLEQSQALDAAAAWSLVTNGVAVLADNFVRTNSAAGTAYYRLRLP